MKKILVICGMTATGKTNLAAKLAQEFDGELISADSRQIYKGMDVGTGKDKPKGMRVWGYDLVAPNEEFSVKQWVEMARAAVKDIWVRNKLPIVVGGAGLYLSNLTKPAGTLAIVPNRVLREKLNRWDVSELQQKLQQLDQKRWTGMNRSDRLNPRRLIRAIEVAGKHKLQTRGLISDSLWIGLRADKNKLDTKISLRVIQRAGGGMTGEVKSLIQLYPNWEQLPALTATGYSEWRRYLEGKLTHGQAVNLWQRAERQYAKRQLVWFKKQTQIHWFDINAKDWHNQARLLVTKWYG